MIPLALQFGCPIEMLRNAITLNSNGAPQSILGGHTRSDVHDDALAFLVERT
jgi:hypothetical protein